MAKTLEDFLKEMNDGPVGVSKYNIRNENSQTADRVKKFKLLKKDDKKRSKICPLKEIAVPFNPVTGKKDKDYHDDSKFRPALSIQGTVKLIKGIVNKFPDAKEAYLRYSGLKAWDTSDETIVTKTDMDVLRNFIVPRIFTIDGCHVDIKAMGTGKYGRDYKLNVEKDPDTKKIIGELPYILKAHKFFNAMAYEEMQEYNKKVESGEEKATDAEKKKAYQDIFSKIPVGDYQPTNYSMMIELGLTATCEPTVETSKLVKTATSAEIAPLIVLAKWAVKQDKGFRSVVEGYLRKEYPKYDVHKGFWEVDMRCPESSTNPGQRGIDTKFEKPSYLIGDPTDAEMEADSNVRRDSEQFDEAVATYLDEIDNLERIILNSISTFTYNEDVEKQLISALPSVIDLDNPYLTKSVILGNKDFISLTFGTEGDRMIDEAEEEVSEKNDGEYDETKADAAKKAFDLSALEETDIDSLDGTDEDGEETDLPLQEVDIK